jgi:hypothetical protein
MKIQLDCMKEECGAKISGPDRFLEGRSCPNCKGLTMPRPFNPTAKQIPSKPILRKK